MKAKKKYVKPMAAIQCMAVNNFVAGACSDAGAAIVHFYEDTCTYVDPSSYMIFFSQQCEKDDSGFGVDIVHPNPTSPSAQLCYHRPVDALSFFNS